MHDLISFGSTKPTAHPEDEKVVSPCNAKKPSHLDVDVCRRNVIIQSSLPQYNHMHIISINSTVLLTKIFM
jgi:hypothetical protein